MNILEKILEEIKTLKRKQNSSNQDFLTGYTSALSTVEGIMCSHMDEHNGDNAEMIGWIPVSVRVPEEEGNVLVTVNGRCKSTRFENAIMLGEYDDMFKEWVIEGWEYWENPNVTAWMPLPEPYAPKEPTKQSALSEREKFFTEGVPIYERTQTE